MTIPPDIEELVAIHEAGHVVCMLALGSVVEYVTIKPQGRIIGHVRPRTGNRSGDALAETSAGMMALELFAPGGQSRIDAFLQTYIADGPDSEDCNASDSSLAEAFVNVQMVKVKDATLVFPTDEQKHQAYVAAMVKAANIIELHWFALLDIAAKLRQFKTLSGAHAASLFRAAPRRQRNHAMVPAMTGLSQPTQAASMELVSV